MYIIAIDLNPTEYHTCEKRSTINSHGSMNIYSHKSPKQ